MDRICKKGEATALEQQIAVALNEVAASAEEGSKKVFNNLKIAGVSKIEQSGMNVYIITVPYKQVAAYHSVQTALVAELEKKLGDCQVVIVGKRRAFPKTCEKGRRYRSIRPNGRTLKAVNEALLDDVVFPTSIVGKRTHYDLKGGQTLHVILDQNDKSSVEDRLAAFGAAYNKLTGLRTVFEIAEH